ncbi:MAG TPA: T9SS type A sorting domain-containing protein, partial [Bacteroidia bacterium]|nr:T9SS type A sorting domain-containing protein [Bacteroidia bacterium]
IGFVVGGNGLSPGFILKTVNSGDNWTLNYTPSVTLTDVCFPNSNVGYACGEAGTILKYSGTVAIEENENAQPLLTTYPNPAGKQLSVSSYQSSGKSTIEIYDVLGKKVLSAQPQTSNLKLTPLTFPT